MATNMNETKTTGNSLAFTCIALVLSIQKAMTAKWAELQKMEPEQRKAEQDRFYKARFEELEELLTPQHMTQYREIRNRRWNSQNRRR